MARETSGRGHANGASSSGPEAGRGRKGGGKSVRWGSEEWNWDRGDSQQVQVEYFTGSQKNTRPRPPAERHLSSDDDDDVEQCALCFDNVMRWVEDSADVRDFQECSNEIMRGDWHAVAEMLRRRPELCAMRVPSDSDVAAGYGLIHTLCTKACPDDITDWVIHRTPMDILSIGGHKAGSTRELPPTYGTRRNQSGF